MKTIKQKISSLPLGVKASVCYVICNILQSGVKFISLPVFSRLLSTSEMGQVTLYTSWLNVVFIFATLSLGRANGVYYVAMSKYPNDKDTFTSAMYGLNIICCLSVFLFVLIIRSVFGDWMGIGISFYIPMFMELIGEGIVLIYSLYLRLQYRFGLLMLVTAIYSAGNVVISLLFILFRVFPFSGAAVRICTGAAVSLSVGIIIVLFQKNRTKLYHRDYWKYAFLFNIQLIPHYLSGVILVQSDRIMIGKMIGKETAAIYNVAYIVSVAVQLLTQALINYINPWMYQKIRDGRSKEVSKNVNFIFILVGLLVCTVSLIAPELYRVLFPPEYYEALDIIPVISASVLWSFIYSIFTGIELYYEGNRYVSAASCSGALVNIVLNFLLIPVFGYKVAAYTTLIGNIVYCLVHYLFASKLIKERGNNFTYKFKYNFITGSIFTMVSLGTILLYPFMKVRFASVVLVAGILFHYRRYLLGIIQKR